MDKQLDIFYNTTHMSDVELKKHRMIAGGQCREILNFFRGNPTGSFTPFEVQIYANLQKYPITSIRRAINTLTTTDPPYLVKTNVKKPGEYGTDNHTWRLV